LRLSLAGAQDKLPLVFRNGRFSLPLGNTPSTHILKPEPERFPGLAGNEFFCLKLAAAIGLNAVPIEFRTIGSKPCVLVKRYDRREHSTSQVARVHQEDFCQALGKQPGRKYQDEGGSTVAESVALLRNWSTVPVMDIRGFVDGLVFNLLVGNADAHGKNYSMIYEKGGRRLAPLYDLVCTLAWPELSRNLAMRIGTARHINEVNTGHWRKMSIKAGLGWPMVRERIGGLTENVLQKLHGVAESAIQAGAASSVVDQMSQIIYDRACNARNHWAE
jgi:serine/threonine-protein kinase HipA